MKHVLSGALMATVAVAAALAPSAQHRSGCRSLSVMADPALLNNITDRLAGQLITPAGQPASHDHVADVVEAAARSLASARVQQFVPILVENLARNELRGQGMRRAPA